MIENRARLSKVENADDDEKVPYNPQLVTVYDLPKEVAPAARLSTRPHRSTRRGHHTSLFAQSPPKPTSLSSTPSPSRPGSPRCDLNARDSGETRRLSEPVRSSKHKRQEYNDYNSMRQCAEQYPSYPTESARDHSMLPIYNPTVTHSRHDSLNEDGRPEAHAAWILVSLMFHPHLHSCSATTDLILVLSLRPFPILHLASQPLFSLDHHLPSYSLPHFYMYNPQISPPEDYQPSERSFSLSAQTHILDLRSKLGASWHRALDWPLLPGMLDRDSNSGLGSCDVLVLRCYSRRPGWYKSQ